MRTPLEIGHVLRAISSKMKTNNKIASDFTGYFVISVDFEAM